MLSEQHYDYKTANKQMFLQFSDRWTEEIQNDDFVSQTRQVALLSYSLPDTCALG